MKNNNILLITDNENVSNVLRDKLLLLRAVDDIYHTDYENSYSTLLKLNPALIFIYECDRQDVVQEYLKYIKNKLPESVIVLIADKFDPDFIMSMYDLGLDDYILTNSIAADILIKTVNALKQSAERKNAQRDKNLLINLGVISLTSGFYTEKNANELMAKELDKIANKESAFLIVTYDELDRAKFVFEMLADAVKKSIRRSDIVIELKTGKFYILLSGANIRGAVSVFEKIKNTVGDEFRIKAGISATVGKSFQEIEQKASVALTDAMLSADDYEIYQEQEIISDDDWILETDNGQKDYKLFKQAFNKKLEKMITPVFYKLQNMYEDTLANTKIEQYTDENQCIFHLKSPSQTSRLTLIYPGFAKVVIYITHSGLDSPENKEIIIPLKQLTESVLTEIIEIFINDYKTCIDV